MTKTDFLCATAPFFSFLALPSPAIAAPEDAASAYRPVSIETQVEGVDPSRADRLEPQLEAAGRRALKVHGVETTEGEGATIVFHVRGMAEGDPKENAAKAVSDYGTHIEVLIDGASVGEEVTLCVSKGEAELVECALGGIPAVLGLLPREDVVPDVASSQPPGPDQPQPAKAEKSPLVWVGAGLLVAGGATLAAGIPMHLHDESGSVADGDTGLAFERERYPRSTTIPLLLVGSGLAVTGVALLTTGLVKNARARKKSTAIAPVVSTGFAGVSIQGRF